MRRAVRRNRLKTCTLCLIRSNMLPRRMVIVGLLYCCIKTGVTRSRSKGTDYERPAVNIREEVPIPSTKSSSDISELFPAAKRIKRGLTSAMANPIFHSTFTDVHLLFEILVSGIYFTPHGEFSVNDAELASLRKTRSLDLICEEIIPKKITDIFRLIADLSNVPGHLHQDEFERTLLTLVYTIQQTAKSTGEHQKDAWAQSFVDLYRAIKKDLTTAS